MTEGVGKTVYDYSGNQTHGELVGGVSWDSSGPEAVLKFDGKTGYVDIPGGAWNIGSPATYLCWYKAQGNGDIRLRGRWPSRDERLP